MALLSVSCLSDLLITEWIFFMFWKFAILSERVYFAHLQTNCYSLWPSHLLFQIKSAFAVTISFILLESIWGFAHASIRAGVQLTFPLIPKVFSGVSGSSIHVSHFFLHSGTLSHMFRPLSPLWGKIVIVQHKKASYTIFASSFKVTVCRSPTYGCDGQDIHLHFVNRAYFEFVEFVDSNIKDLNSYVQITIAHIRIITLTFVHLIIFVWLKRIMVLQMKGVCFKTVLSAHLSTNLFCFSMSGTCVWCGYQLECRF